MSEHERGELTEAGIPSAEEMAALREIIAAASKGPLTLGRVPEHEEPDTCIIGSGGYFWARVVGGPGRKAAPDAQIFVAGFEQIGRYLAAVERLSAENRVLAKKASTTLANNLCPDCRDKQAGKPCLACENARLTNERAAAQARVRELGICLHELHDLGGPPMSLDLRPLYFAAKERASKLLAALEGRDDG